MKLIHFLWLTFLCHDALAVSQSTAAGFVTASSLASVASFKVYHNQGTSLPASPFLSEVSYQSTSQLFAINPMIGSLGWTRYGYVENAFGKLDPNDSNKVEIFVSGSVFLNAHIAKPLKDVVVMLKQGEEVFSNSTDGNGEFKFTLTSGSGIELTATRDHGEGKASRGVDVADIVEIRKHILARARFENARQMVAADTNRDASVDVADIVAMRKIILARTDYFSEDGDGKKQTFWRFVDADFNNLSVYQAFDHVLASEKINLASLSGDVSELNFAAIKLGDVNMDWNDSNATTLSDRASIQTEELMSLGSPRVSLDGAVWLDLYAEKTKGLVGMQFGLKWDEQVLRLVRMETHQLQGYSQQFHSHLQDGRAGVVWDNATLSGVDIQANQPVMTLHFALQAGADRGTMIELIQPMLVELEGSTQASMGVASYYHPEGVALLSSRGLIRSLHHREGAVILEFETQAGMSYLVERTQDLGVGLWEAVFTIEGKGRHEAIEVATTDQEQVYFRVREISGRIE